MLLRHEKQVNLTGYAAAAGFLVSSGFALPMRGRTRGQEAEDLIYGKPVPHEQQAARKNSTQWPLAQGQQ
jgi:hypothetical protein